ncbi:hypothetical protein [Ferruginibacter albus]|uniref:hypothetical protein n=1 Tax=Ferruginibacter albus TaxID=2875540 RepID=UPI001CC65899|nr:hypothetical protein [Ferruginibacter albus]UAY50759.1 hypothetical protein K9M53_09160 [Ferruginibacter albus]
MRYSNHKIFFLFSLLIVSLSVVAQQPAKSKRELRKERINALIKQEEEGVIAYKKHTLFGLMLHTNGYGAFMEMGRAQSIRKSLLFQLQISELKDPREEKVSGISDFSFLPYIYGKINFFYPVRLGVQQQYLLGNKANKNGVSVTANVGGGLSLGLLRPYYVQVGRIDTSQQQIYYDKDIKYNSPDSSRFVNGPILGGPDLGKGWNELKMTPGLYLKTAVRFDYGKYNEVISALEVGLIGEFYTKKIPLMVYQPQKQFFLTGYITLMFGSRK